MDMIESIHRIKQLERRVMWRRRWLAFQDAIAQSILIAGLASAAIVLYIRLKPIELRWWTAAAAIFAVVTTVVTVRWILTRATEREAAFSIDERLNLEDRITTARALIDRGGPQRAVEIALIEDAATRISQTRASTIAPYNFPRWYALSLTAALAAAVAVMVPQKALPGSKELAAERVEIQTAGEQLERTSQEVEQIAPSGTETAKLAREQADLGRALRRSIDTRAEALRKLSALEDRIRQRHDKLADTRADEVVTLAEQRLRSAAGVNAREKPDGTQLASATRELPASEQPRSNTTDMGGKQADPNRDTATPGVNQNPTKADQAKVNTKAATKSAGDKTSSADERGEENRASSKDDAAKATEQSPPSNEKSQPNAQPQPQAAGSKPETQTSAPAEDKTPVSEGEKTDDQRAGDKRSEASGGLTGAIAEQAAKALPSLSKQLLKKAEQMRANELKPEDIKQLQLAAQLLARDLTKIAQSKEFQQAVEELAKEVKPEQLEQVARELANQEQLKQELEAAARLMMENKQVKQMVAGLAQQLAEQRDQFQQEQRGKGGDQVQPGESSWGEQKSRGGGRDSAGNRRQGSGGTYERMNSGERLNVRGREERLTGKLDRVPGGEYLYLKAKPGAGPSRSAYSSAYPQYRREAERSVERSRVPPRMRSIVRDYFDAINPDVGKKP